MRRWKEGSNCRKLDNQNLCKFHALIKYYRGNKMKEGVMPGACRKHGKADKCVKIAFGRPDIKLTLKGLSHVANI